MTPHELCEAFSSPDVATDYAKDVVMGRLVTGRSVYQACLRHLQDIYKQLTDDDYPYFYDAETGGLVVDFCRELKHYKGEWAGQPFVPEPWQEFVICSVFGWLRRSNFKRRFRYAYIQIARKNGKTFLAAAIALWMLLMDGEGGAEVYSAANTREQAKRTWDDSNKFLKRNPDFHSLVTLRYNTIHAPDTDSFYSPLAADSSNLDGLNPSGVVYDELHAAPDRKLWDILEDAFGSRSQPLYFVITTAGFDKFGICFEQRRHILNVLDAVENEELDYQDDYYFGYVAELDPDDDPYDEENWIKGNPNLHISKDLEYLREQAGRAKRIASKEPSFFIKQINLWVNTAVRWLNQNLWLKHEVQPEEVVMRHRCYAGLDMSTNIDVTAFVRIFSPGTYHPSKFYILPRLYFPKDNLEERCLRDKVPYREWADKGWLQLTEGNSVDTIHIRDDVTLAGQQTFISAIGVDPWKATALVSDFEALGHRCYAVSQGYAAMTAPCLLLERLVLKDMIVWDGNPMFTWMVGNCAVDIDKNENIKPSKEESNERIDGISALLTGLAVLLEDEGAPPILTIA
jgi:phage terminase large subunit-like protein